MADTPFHALIQMYLRSAVSVFAGSVALALSFIAVAYYSYLKVASMPLLVLLLVLAAFVAFLGFALYSVTLKAMHHALVAMGEAIAHSSELREDEAPKQ